MVTWQETVSLKVDVCFVVLSHVLSRKRQLPLFWLMLPGARRLQDRPSRCSPEPFPSLASAKGHGTLYLCPCPGPHLYSTYLIRGQAWPCRGCQEALSTGPPGNRLGRWAWGGFTALALPLFEGFGKINRPPLWSAFVRQRPGVFKLLGLLEIGSGSGC